MVAERRRELAHLARVSMVGELSGAIAHELNQPLTAILSNAQAAQRMLNADDVSSREVYDILTDIVSEDKRAVLVIERLRALLTKDKTDTEIMGERASAR
jgi:C4-dicarboxylate-specific signal transduction histidine kinase